MASEPLSGFQLAAFLTLGRVEKRVLTTLFPDKDLIAEEIRVEGKRPPLDEMRKRGLVQFTDPRQFTARYRTKYQLTGLGRDVAGYIVAMQPVSASEEVAISDVQSHGLDGHRVGQGDGVA